MRALVEKDAKDDLRHPLEKEPFTFSLFKEYPQILSACDYLCGSNGQQQQQPVGKDRERILAECGDSVLKKVKGKKILEIDPEALAKYLLGKYGTTGWHDWNCNNWGTKWNACSIELKEETDEELHYYYETAWSPALPALEHATAKFPELTFRVTYTEESDACAGLVIFHGGEVVKQREVDPNMNSNGYLQTKYVCVLYALASLPPEQLAQVEGTIEEFEWDDDYFSSGTINTVLRAVLADELHMETFTQDLIEVLELNFDDPEAIEILNGENILGSEEELDKLTASMDARGTVKEIQDLFLKNAKEFKSEKTKEKE